MRLAPVPEGNTRHNLISLGLGSLAVLRNSVRSIRSNRFRSVSSCFWLAMTRLKRSAWPGDLPAFACDSRAGPCAKQAKESKRKAHKSHSRPAAPGKETERATQLILNEHVERS